MHSCCLKVLLLLSSILGSGQVGLGGGSEVPVNPPKSSDEPDATLRPGLLSHAFVSVPRRGIISKAVDGHPPFLLVRL